MQTRLSKRRLIVATLLVQGVLLAIGWFVTFRRVSEEVHASSERRLASASTRLVEQFSELVEASPRSEAIDWEDLQSLCEGLSVDGVVVALLDRRGRVVCHPDLRHDVSLRGVDLVPRLLRTQDAGSVVMRYIPRLEASLVVRHPSAALQAAAKERAGSIAAGLAGGVSVLLLSGAVTLLLVRRYDTELAGINRRLSAEVDRRVAQSLRATHALIVGLARLAETRDADTGSHLERLRAYSRVLAGELRRSSPAIDDAWIERLGLAACLHDVGKVAVPDAVLRKPGALDQGELAVMRTHVTAGAATLRAVRDALGTDPLIDLALDVTRSHHERWDGEGYPDGLAGEAIPLGARIVALADAYDAMTTDRVYRRGVSHAEARARIAADRGTHFDPEVVDAFLRAEARIEAIRRGLDQAPLRLAA